MIISRPQYLRKLIEYKDNGRVKIITGIRRCGKSFLLNPIFSDYLKSQGVTNDCIVTLELDKVRYAKYRNPLYLSEYLIDRTKDSSKQYYVMLDEIQMVEPIANPYLPAEESGKIGFVDVLLDLMSQNNVDLYVTGSNSRMLSTDVATGFRDRGDEIQVWPLNFGEYVQAYDGSAENAWNEFTVFGGMPYAVNLDNPSDKSDYLRRLFQLTYIKDIIERYKLHDKTDTLTDLLNCIASAIGSLTNPNKLANTMVSEKKIKIVSTTVSTYIGYLVDAFLIKAAYRYDVKGREYINTPLKYFFTDLGLRNALLNFRQQEENHIMENIIYNELSSRGFNVDVGVVEHRIIDNDGVRRRQQLEVDFVCNKSDKRYYIQSALSIDTPQKQGQELNSLKRINDSFAKIVVVKDGIVPYHDNDGIYHIGVIQFLLDYINRM